MQIKRSVSRIFSVLVIPAIAFAVVAYFGTYAIWGDRGVLALEDTQARLGVQQQQLAQLQDSRAPAGASHRPDGKSTPTPTWSRNWPAAS